MNHRLCMQRIEGSSCQPKVFPTILSRGGKATRTTNFCVHVEAWIEALPNKSTVLYHGFLARKCNPVNYLLSRKTFQLIDVKTQDLTCLGQRFREFVHLRTEMSSDKECRQYADDCEDLDRVKASMQSAKAVEVTLRLVLASTSKVVARLQDRFKDLINHSRFMDLPDDIRSFNFQFRVSLGASGRLPHLHRCVRRFREIVVRLPTGIDFPLHSVRYASLLASRSAAPNMSFVISDVYNISGRSDRFSSYASTRCFNIRTSQDHAT